MRTRCIRATVSEGLRLEAGTRVPHTRVFSGKRLQAIENKGRECRKERKETGKRQQMPENNGFATPTRSGQAAARRHRVRRGIGGLYPHTRGAMGIVVKIKGLREKAIRKNMKTKGRQKQSGLWVMSSE